MARWDGRSGKVSEEKIFLRENLFNLVLDTLILGFNEGIFGIRYGLKTLSDMGVHHVALRKATGIGFGTTEYMLRHNATSLWESWWRSEGMFLLICQFLYTC